MRDKLPRKAQMVKTPLGLAKVISTNTLKETVTVELESGATAEVALDDITVDQKEPARPPKKEPEAGPSTAAGT
jgi:hypothetical protein